MSLTTDPTDPGLRVIEPSGMQKTYLVLSEEERGKGFVMPVYRSYRHMKCGCDTEMGLALCETYARDPKFYGGTYCCHCGTHFRLRELVKVPCRCTVGLPNSDNCSICADTGLVGKIQMNFYWVEADGNRFIPVGASPEEAEAIWAEKARQDAEKVKGAGI